MRHIPGAGGLVQCMHCSSLSRRMVEIPLDSHTCNWGGTTPCFILLSTIWGMFVLTTAPAFCRDRRKGKVRKTLLTCAVAVEIQRH